MSFLSWVFNLFLKIFAKPLLKYAPLIPERLRKMQAFEKRFSKFSRLPKAARVEEMLLKGVPSLLIQKNRDYQKTEGIIFYLHGGGYCAGSPHAYKRLVWPLVKACNLPAIVIDYRQSPDHVFPAALDDSISAYQALLEQGYRAEDIYIMGDSAGGNLTLASLLKMKALQLPRPKAAVVISPWADLSNSGQSMRYNEKKDPYIPGFKQMDRAARLYAGNTPLNDPLLSPVFADLSGLPPLKIVVGDLEVLLDDARRVAEAARAAGVSVDYKAWKGQCHVFPLFAFFPEAKQCLAEIADFVEKHKTDSIQLAA